MDFYREAVFGYILFFFGKITEVTLATLRYILINRGERKKAALLLF